MTFDIDANGILHVSAKDKGTGKEQKISIQGSSGLSKDEIERAKRDAEAHAEEDKKRAEEIDIINQADSLCFSVERQLKDMGDNLPADLKREIEDKVTRLKEAVSKKDVKAIKAGKEDLESRLEALYKAAEAAQQSAGAAGPMPGAPAEEEPSDGPRKAKGRVVDAEIVDDDK
ncbi:MAG: Hsp70 family protein [Akkermansia sp.]